MWMFVAKLEDVSIDFHKRCGGQCLCPTLHTASLEVAPCLTSEPALVFGIVTGRPPSVAMCWLLHFCCINLLQPFHVPCLQKLKSSVDPVVPATACTTTSQHKAR